MREIRSELEANKKMMRNEEEREKERGQRGSGGVQITKKNCLYDVCMMLRS